MNILSIIKFLLFGRQFFRGKAVVDDSNNSAGPGYKKYASVPQRLVYDRNLKIGMFNLDFYFLQDIFLCC